MLLIIIIKVNNWKDISGIRFLIKQTDKPQNDILNLVTQYFKVNAA